MHATLTAEGHLEIPQELRQTAHLRPGDQVDIQFHEGALILRKHQPLTVEQRAALLRQSRGRPAPKPEDERAVEEAIREVRSQRR